MAIKVYNDPDVYNKEYAEEIANKTMKKMEEVQRNPDSWSRDKDSPEYEYESSAQGKLDHFVTNHADEIASGNWENELDELDYRYLLNKAANGDSGSSSGSSSKSSGSTKGITTITKGSSGSSGTDTNTYQELLNRIEQEQIARAAADREAAATALAKQNEKSQTENYIGYRQQLAKVQDLIDSLGLGKSGATETTLADMLSDYGTGRNDLNSGYTSSLADLQKTYADTAADSYQTKLQAIANYVQSQQNMGQQEIYSLLEAALTQNGEDAPSKSTIAAIAAALAKGYDITDIIAELWG